MKKLLVFFIKLYQIINPFKGTCRFMPTCSEYSIEAIKKYGILKGARLSIGRILKCHPGGGGIDPVR